MWTDMLKQMISVSPHCVAACCWMKARAYCTEGLISQVMTLPHGHIGLVSVYTFNHFPGKTFSYT